MKLTIIFSAMASTGKSTVAKAIAKKYNLDFYDGGDVLKLVAKDEGYNVTESKGWWDTEEGMKFLEKRKQDPQFDHKVDEKFIEIAEKGNVVFTSWTLPWLYKKGIKIWLHASIEERAKRMSGRDNIEFEKALEIIKQRDRKNVELYKKLYNIDYGDDLKPFDIIINTDNMPIEEVIENTSRAIDRVIENETN